MGMPLQAAERMAAHTGPWALFAGELKSQYFAENSNLLSNITYETGRARDFLTAAQILMGIRSLPNHSQFGSATLDKWLKNTEVPTSELKADVRRVLDDLTEVFASDNFRGQRVSPIEFVMTAVLVYQHRGSTIEAKVNYASQFRTRLRTQFVDLRINSKVINFAWGILDDFP